MKKVILKSGISVPAIGQGTWKIGDHPDKRAQDIAAAHSANVDADNIRNIIDGFLDMNNGLPLFLFIEVPANIKDKKVIGENEDGSVV